MKGIFLAITTFFDVIILIIKIFIDVIITPFEIIWLVLEWLWEIITFLPPLYLAGGCALIFICALYKILGRENQS